jgi:hypothetical protein
MEESRTDQSRTTDPTIAGNRAGGQTTTELGPDEETTTQQVKVGRSRHNQKETCGW